MMVPELDDMPTLGDDAPWLPLVRAILGGDVKVPFCEPNHLPLPSYSLLSLLRYEHCHHFYNDCCRHFCCLRATAPYHCFFDYEPHHSCYHHWCHHYSLLIDTVMATATAAIPRTPHHGHTATLYVVHSEPPWLRHASVALGWNAHERESAPVPALSQRVCPAVRHDDRAGTD
jgi:hypothetical protein